MMDIHKSQHHIFHNLNHQDTQISDHQAHNKGHRSPRRTESTRSTATCPSSSLLSWTSDGMSSARVAAVNASLDGDDPSFVMPTFPAANANEGGEVLAKEMEDLETEEHVSLNFAVRQFHFVLALQAIKPWL